MSEDPSVAERLGSFLAGVGQVPHACGEMAGRLLLDVAGLCLAARRERYVEAVLGTAERAGGGWYGARAFGGIWGV